MANLGAPGSRGGWSNTLTTENIMKDLGVQQSLTEDLRDGTINAHRQVVGGEREFRNARRTAPLQVKNVYPAKQDTTEYSAESSDAAAPPSQVGVPFNQQLAKHRQRIGG